MRGRDKHLIDNDEEEEEEDVYMYLGDMTPNERAEFRAACRASKSSECNWQQEKRIYKRQNKNG